MGIGPMTSPLPRECSTTEPLEQLSKIRKNLGREWSGRQDSNLRHPPWKGGALPTELRPRVRKTLVILVTIANGGERRIRTFEGLLRQIYSLLPLAARQPLLKYQP
jgi:hypothetical protein